jgi:hypothetical protein
MAPNAVRDGSVTDRHSVHVCTRVIVVSCATFDAVFLERHPTHSDRFLLLDVLPGAAGGDLAKLYYASRKNEGRRAVVAAVLLFDLVIGLLSLVLISLLACAIFQ